MHDALTLGLAIASPIFSVMPGVLVNQRALDKTEARIDHRLDRLERATDEIKAEQSPFFETLATHDAKIGVLMDERRKP